MDEVVTLVQAGNRLAAAGQLEAALACYRRALGRAPDHPELRTNLGNVLLGLGRTTEAVACYRAVLALGFDHPQVHYNLGTALRAQGQPAAALAAFAAALALSPDFAAAHNNRGNALRDLERYAEAAAAYLEALARRPDDAQARSNLAGVLSLLHHQEQQPSTRQRQEQQPSSPEQGSGQGEPGQAGALARRWLARDPEDAMARHVVAALTGGPAPERAEDGYVRQLFDGFAADFEQRLTELDYRVPGLVAAALARWWPQPAAEWSVLDAGCGTGLCAPTLRRHARTLLGVDLSPEMLERARRRGLYDRLEAAELTAFLAGHPAAFDLIVAADVLCYFGALAPVLAAAAAALRPDGRLLFTVEHDPDPAAAPFTLQANGRYRHAAATVRTALAAAGLAPGAITAVTLRRENGREVPGLLVESGSVGVDGPDGVSRGGAP
jgi:predicted TPR repeat methyltransferase